MVNLNPVIADIEAQCRKCKIGEAIRLLREIQAEFGLAVQTSHEPKPKPAAVSWTIAVKAPKQPRKAAKGPAGTRTEKACHKCGQVKPLEEYPKNKTCRDGHTGTCRVCTVDRLHANYKEKHPPAPVSDKPYRCDKCGKRFITKFVIDEHVKKCGAEA